MIKLFDENTKVVARDALHAPRTAFAIAFAASLITPQFAAAQETLPAGFADFLVDVCMFEQTTDLPADLATAKAAATSFGLPELVNNDDMAMYGVFGEMTFMLSKTVDSLVCVLDRPAENGGDHAFYEELETAFGTAFNAKYPGNLESLDNDPSPHDDTHGWIIRTAVNDAAIISLDFGTADGVQVSGILAKKYD